ncbi:maleylacetoacetate isomerase [Variovorax sp. YR216]|uniref:maleylacetoacetate isomerase n=1 Tax=Variovorax sp. YR216 TaxID=1882828 RepID=UPI00089AC72B|nr:maleylacetoacetate isomerase [Variovorax sp. YR216]SEA85815.1 maleylpyruvate isomerase [Variovorax sp. YR216]
MELFNFFRSGTSHRLRIALNLKGLAYDYRAIDLPRDEHLSAEYKRLNPQGLVPALVHDGKVLIQTPAILEWLEERHPTPSLLPEQPEERARVRALASIVGCDIHPLNNRRVLELLRKKMKCDESTVNEWCETWIAAGFDALEALLQTDSKRGEFCFGGTPTLADVYLIPQVESARRFKVDIGRWPAIQAVDAACSRIEAFRAAAPSQQPDAR